MGGLAESDVSDRSEAGAPRRVRPGIDGAAFALVAAVASGILTWSQLPLARAIWATVAIAVGILGLWAWIRTAGRARTAIVVGCGVLLLASLAMVQRNVDKPVLDGEETPPSPAASPSLAPTAAPAPAASPPLRQGPPLPGYVLGRSGPWYVELRSTAVPPQKNFDPHTWSYTDNDDHGVTVECRSATDHKAGCKPGHEPVYYIDPVEPGTKIAVVDPAATTHVCAGMVYDSRAVPVQVGKAYCVTGNRHVLVIDVLKLPDRIVGNDTVVTEMHGEFWTQS